MKSAILKNFWPVFIWAILVFTLSAVPGNSFPEIKSFWDWLGPDKIVHFAFYSVLCFLLLRGFIRYNKSKSLNYVVISLVSGIVFGLMIEVMQYYVFKGRDGNVYDFIANVIGCLLGVAVFWAFNRKIMTK